MRILTVVGNRPQFIKAAAVSGPLRAEHEELLVHTGQHYDERSRTCSSASSAARARRDLGVGGAAHLADRAHAGGPQALLVEATPDAVLVYGDVNSTLAGALAAAQPRVPVAHVEAGCARSTAGCRRSSTGCLCDRLSALLLCAS